jgi:TonB family protein
VTVWNGRLDESGGVVRAEIGRSSGYALFDEAALEVVDAMRLAPARNRGAPVRVIVTVPVRFTVQR